MDMSPQSHRAHPPRPQLSALQLVLDAMTSGKLWITTRRLACSHVSPYNKTFVGQFKVYRRLLELLALPAPGSVHSARRRTCFQLPSRLYQTPIPSSTHISLLNLVSQAPHLAPRRLLSAQLNHLWWEEPSCLPWERQRKSMRL